jgi:transposase
VAERLNAPVLKTDVGESLPWVRIPPPPPPTRVSSHALPRVRTYSQTSDYIGARALLSSLLQAGARLADRGYDADWFRNALKERDIRPCIPSRRGRRAVIPHAPDLYHQRHRIENMFARLKDLRRITTRYNRCVDLLLSACALAAVVVFWL